jgi:hypothetical protein
VADKGTKGDDTKADYAYYAYQPWVFVGGSYAGMLAAWTGRFYPGVFWAFHAISAPVQIIPEFWEY